MKFIFILLMIFSCIHPVFGWSRGTTRMLLLVFLIIGALAFVIGGPISFISNAGLMVPVCGFVMMVASIFILQMFDTDDL